MRALTECPNLTHLRSLMIAAMQEHDTRCRRNETRRVASADQPSRVVSKRAQRTQVEGCSDDVINCRYVTVCGAVVRSCELLGRSLHSLWLGTVPGPALSSVASLSQLRLLELALSSASSTQLAEFGFAPPKFAQLYALYLVLVNRRR